MEETRPFPKIDTPNSSLSRSGSKHSVKSLKAVTPKNPIPPKSQLVKQNSKLEVTSQKTSIESVPL